ncbi:MAG TPA: DUF4139 domain-containing protein [Phycisphaerae bacterium]|nr:DUF4139 domain-containing protein [Phycisphaerae bacterium]
MLTRHASLLTTFALLTAATAAFAQAPATQPAPTQPDAGPSLTVYSSADPAGFDPQQFIHQQRLGYSNIDPSQIPGFGVVKETRNLALHPGENNVAVTDVAEYIDPTTVSFSDLTDPQTSVLQQQFKFDLVSPAKLLEKYVDQPITLLAALGNNNVETVTGTLLSTNQGQLVVQTTNGLRMFVASQVQVQLGKLPEGLITRPTLDWQINATQAGQHRVRTTYQTSGLTWRADYTLVLNADDTAADLGAWVTLLNLSGASYNNAQLKLIAGDVQRVQPQPYGARGGFAMDAVSGPATGFEEKSFYEYHLYTLPRRTDIKDNSTEQIALFPTVHNVSVEKVLVYYGLPANFSQYMFVPNPVLDRDIENQSNHKVDAYIRFKNAENNHLGIPLPRGKVRVYKQDSSATGGDGSLEFVGEDLIDHTPKDRTLLIKTGQSFDITGDRTQTDFTVDNSRREMTESIKIVLHNPTKQPVTVIVKENLFRWVNWEITKSSDNYEKIDSRTIHFNEKVPPEGDTTVTYTVKYTW